MAGKQRCQRKGRRKGHYLCFETISINFKRPSRQKREGLGAIRGFTLMASKYLHNTHIAAKGDKRRENRKGKKAKGHRSQE